MQGAVPSNSTLMNWMPPCEYRARACADTLAVEAEAAAAGSATEMGQAAVPRLAICHSVGAEEAALSPAPLGAERHGHDQ